VSFALRQAFFFGTVSPPLTTAQSGRTVLLAGPARGLVVRLHAVVSQAYVASTHDGDMDRSRSSVSSLATFLQSTTLESADSATAASQSDVTGPAGSLRDATLSSPSPFDVSTLLRPRKVVLAPPESSGALSQPLSVRESEHAHEAASINSSTTTAVTTSTANPFSFASQAATSTTTHTPSPGAAAAAPLPTALAASTAPSAGMAVTAHAPFISRIPSTAPTAAAATTTAAAAAAAAAATVTSLTSLAAATDQRHSSSGTADAATHAHDTPDRLSCASPIDDTHVVLIEEVLPSGPAALAGLRRGDLVAGFNGVAARAENFGDLIACLSSPGDLTLFIWC
jgi:hypothetical protein